MVNGLCLLNSKHLQYLKLLSPICAHARLQTKCYVPGPTNARMHSTLFFPPSLWEESMCLLRLCIGSGISLLILMDRRLANETGKTDSPVKKEYNHIYEQLESKCRNERKCKSMENNILSHPNKSIQCK